MVHVKPFIGLRYNPAKLASYKQVTAPPYDVISPDEQQRLHDLSPYNVVRLILGLKQPDDNDTNNVYTRAHYALQSWIETGILKPDDSPAFYAYSQSWDTLERRGFIAALALEQYENGSILPHEYTLGGPKADRLALMKATGSVLSPIFCLYNDPDKTMEQALFEDPPAHAIEVTDKDNVLHRFWPVTEPVAVKALQRLLADKAVLIADGHHRYETALAYQAYRRELDGQQDAPQGSLPWDYTMAFFTNMADEGLKVYPTHRVFTSMPEGWTQGKLVQELNRFFQPCDEHSALFWLESKDIPRMPYRLKSGVDVSALPAVLEDLDVALLDHFVFQNILKHSANDLKQAGHLHFIREDREVQGLVRQKALVFWVEAPSVQKIREVCEAGFRMPQKSTYFYPKLLSGLVMYAYDVQSE